MAGPADAVIPSLPPVALIIGKCHLISREHVARLISERGDETDGDCGTEKGGICPPTLSTVLFWAFRSVWREVSSGCVKVTEPHPVRPSQVVQAGFFSVSSSSCQGPPGPGGTCDPSSLTRVCPGVSSQENDLSWRCGSFWTAGLLTWCLRVKELAHLVKQPPPPTHAHAEKLTQCVRGK